MFSWIKVVWAAAVLVIPGGFLFLLAYLFARTLRQRYVRLGEDRGRGRPVHFSEVLADIHFKDVLREARAAF